MVWGVWYTPNPKLRLSHSGWPERHLLLPHYSTPVPQNMSSVI